MFRKKHKDLQPWIDYFEMLQKYEKDGFLEMKPEAHEAYITAPAVYTIVGCDFNADEPNRDVRMARSVCHTARRIRTYAGWRSMHGGDYLARPFALHVVKADEPHDLLYTMVITSRRRWWKLWMWHDSVEVITY